MPIPTVAWKKTPHLFMFILFMVGKNGHCSKKIEIRNVDRMQVKSTPKSNGKSKTPLCPQKTSDLQDIVHDGRHPTRSSSLCPRFPLLLTFFPLATISRVIFPSAHISSRPASLLLIKIKAKIRFLPLYFSPPFCTFNLF